MLIFDCLMNKTVGEWLAEELQRAGISQAEVARKSGVSAAHITKVLKGERGLGESALRAIAEALKIPPEQAFREVGFLPPVPAKTEQTEQLLYLFNQLPQNEKDRLIHHIEATLMILEREGLIKRS